ncbi:MAG: cupin domain-containing protein [Thermoleophilia bacterium]|nr:cupin domain-containing protein [Thermoleophilia bacterium]
MPDEWFIRNVADLTAYADGEFGAYFRFAPREAPFADTGMNITVLQPGEANGRYHHESGQEDFLVLAGECICIVHDVEHPMRAWDFFHCPGGTPHIFVGAGSGPCAILMIGAKRDGETIHYPVSEVAGRYGASVSRPTDSPIEAYADRPGDEVPVRLDWPLS